MLIYLVAGLTTGSVFGLAAVGVVLTYKTSGVFNFAHGALASAAAFLFYFLYVQHHMAWPLAAIVVVVVCGPIVGALLELMGRRIASTHATTRVVATVGLLLAIQGAIELVYPPGSDREVRQFLPISSFILAGTPIQWYRVIIFVIGLGAVGVLTLYLKRSRTGLAMRAIVDDPDLLDVAGTNPLRVRRLAWVIGSTTAAASGVLLAPLLPLDATTLTLLVVTAFGAAAIGAFTNLPLTYVGGLAIGIAQALMQKYVVSATGLLAGLAPSIPFILLFLLLAASPRLRNPSEKKVAVRNLAGGWTVPPRIRATAGLALLVVLLLAPSFSGSHLVDWTRFVAYAVVFLALGMLVRVSGQVSLAHMSFMAIGVCAFGQFVHVHHWPWIVGLVVACGLAVPIGAILAIPAIRFPGLYLALASLGFGIAVEQMFYSQPYMFGPFGEGVTVPIPHVPALGLVSDKGYYYLVLLIAGAVGLLVVQLSRSRLGRLLRAMGDSPMGLASCGSSINVSRVLVFAISAALAALGGILDGGALHVIGSDYYNPLLSLQFFALIMITVGELPWYAVAAAAGQVLIPSYISASVTVQYGLSAIFGVSAIAFATTPPDRRQAPASVRTFLSAHFGGPIWPQPSRRPAPAAGQQGAGIRQAASGGALVTDGITVRYGGLMAAQDISLRAERGKITGLIGPNGAGKTTVFNACTGLVKPSGGHVDLSGQRLDRLGAPARARRGIGRTFQQIELFDSLSVRDNIELGYEGYFAGWNPIGHLFSSRRQRQATAIRAQEALELCGLTEIAEQKVSNLSTGFRRRVELARCLSGRFDVLLLDEPSSGLDNSETKAFGAILERVISERGVAILLIEHDMALVNRVCDHIYVIDFGEHLFDGTPAEVRQSPAVRSAYLGEASRADEPRERVEVRSEPADRRALARVGTSGALLAFHGVTAGYGASTVLRDVSWRVHRGEVVALLGPNGAGKTTTLRVASGLLKPTAGKLIFRGSDITLVSPHVRAGAGLCLIPEGRGIFRSLSVAENLRLQTPAGRRHDPEALERALSIFPVLNERMKQVAGSLSGGQQQMLALARAYLAGPELILVDEVSMGLAPLMVDQMFAALRSLASGGVAIVLVEQYVSKALDIADFAFVMRKGQMVFAGPSSELDQGRLLETYLDGETGHDRPRELAVSSSTDRMIQAKGH